jgi:serine/threonine-protein kinase
MSILMRQITDQPARPSSLAPELPAGVDDALAWLLQKDPADRPPSLRAGLAALESAAAQAGIAIATAAWEIHTGPSGKVDTRPPNIASASTTDLPAVKQPSNPWAPSSVKTVSQRSAPTKLAGDDERRRSWRGAIAILGGVLLAAVAVVLLVVRPWDAGTTDRPVKHVIVPVVTDAPAPQPQPVPIPVEAQTVIVSIEGVPDGTEVLVGGMTAGAAPGPVQLPRDSSPMVMTFKVDGYFPASRTVTPDHDQQLVVTLKKKPVSGTKRRPNKDDIIDIFEKKQR